MRADRLLQIVALLRRHERMSAAELARRLEVTPRTIARDIDALSLAGVPVYAERGRAGGYSLLPGFRPDAEALTHQEARALFVAGGTSVADALGMKGDFEQALRKLSTGLPEAHQRQIGQVLDRIVIDPGGWAGAAPATPAAMETVFRAVQEERQLQLEYRKRGASKASTRVVDPWGLVLAGPNWYLVAACKGQPRTYRVNRIERARPLDERADRPARLDLLALWQQLRSAWQDQPSERIVVRVTKAHLELVLTALRMVLLGSPYVVPDGTAHCRVEADVTSLRGTVGMLLGFGEWVEVLEPPQLRVMMVQVADQVRQVYAAGSEGPVTSV